MLTESSGGALKASGVTGPAPVGVLGIGGRTRNFAKALGHPVVAMNNREEGRTLAKELPLPADRIIDYNDPEAVSKIKDWSGRDGLAAILGCTDNVEANAWCLNTLRPHGVCVPVGLPVDPGFMFSAFKLNFSELVIKGSLVATRNQVEDMMQVVAKHCIKGHVTTVTMEEAVNLPKMYLDSHLKGRLVVKLE
ncbi:uncharacterized protein LTR77_001322 [Saxophila tyrrhenica]|uniref:Alcohol dehydrogenase-like C-terminal domain-containing protein n=1 Tax=Saxophila tyrrhenica TaxID=1690608 RepID=A0AAV9PLS5_9PEZI|nr:hypothetical protein LTR77_001322 [Saxophila tyrrhenica]